MSRADRAADPTSFAAIAEPAFVAHDKADANAVLVPEISLVSQYWRIIKRRRWTIIGAMLVALLLGLILSFVSQRLYTAVATVEIARDSAKILNVEGVREDVTMADQEFYQTQYGLLRSRALAERVVTALQLDGTGPLAETITGNSAGAASTDRATRKRAARDLLLEQLSVTPIRQSRLVQVGFTNQDPIVSARIANAWIDNFIKSNNERGFDETRFARQFLEERLQNIRERLEQSEQQLVNYAAQQGVFSIETQSGDGETTSRRSLSEDDLAILNAELNRAVAARVAAEASVRFGSDPRANANSVTSNASIGALRQRRAEARAQYQRLLVQFEPNYPAAVALNEEIAQLDRSIATEEGRVRGSQSGDLRSAYLAAAQRETALRAQVAQKTQKLLADKRKAIQYNIYQREVDTNRELYEALLQRYKEVGIAGGADRTNVSIVDRADVPQKPSSPNIPLNLFIALLLGTLVGLALTIVQEQIDVAISDPSEVQRRLGIPLLGAIPQSAMDDDPKALRVAIADKKSEITEAYLSLRTTIAFTTSHGIPRTTAIVSTRPGEGKSTTAYALASLIANSGKKTLLIDCDMRAPTIHKLIGADNARGLSNALSGWDEFDQLIVADGGSALRVMPAGPTPPNAADLLSNERLKQVLDKLGEHYEHIVLDAPPVIGIADALLLASRAEGTIYVVEAHATRVNQVLAALQRLHSVDAQLLGVALTKFRPEKSAFNYDYGYGYGHSGRAQQEAGALA